jgi:cation diffusion facilitator family transporter
MNNPHDYQSGLMEKQRVAFVSMFASAVLASIKLIAAVITGSLGVLTEAIHSLIDLGATVVTLFAIRWASQPADDDHQFGHAKIESVAALLETVLLFGTAVFVAYEAIGRLITPHGSLTIQWWAFAIMIGSIVVDFNRSRALRKTAMRTSSDALQADATHFESDMWSSFAVLLGLCGVWLGFQWADSVAALLVSAYICKIAWGLGSATLNTLLDAAPVGVTKLIADISEQQDGILSVNQLRVRPAGSTLFVNLDVNVPRMINFAAIADLKTKLASAIHAKIPQADISITATPVALDNETAFDKIGLIAAQRNAAIHHITVQQIHDRMAVSFDFEVDGATTLADAHDQATLLEEAICLGLGGDVEVESHIEPRPIQTLSGEPATAQETKKLELVLQQLAKSQKSLSDLHDVRVRRSEDGLYIHYHCHFAATETVEAVHNSVDQIETGLKSKFKNIHRVVAHAEPLVGGRQKH